MKTHIPLNKPRGVHTPLGKNAIRLICCNGMKLDNFNNSIWDNHRYTFSNIESIVNQISDTEIGMKSHFIQLIEEARINNYIFNGSTIRMILKFPSTHPKDKNVEQKILYGTVSNFVHNTMEYMENPHKSSNTHTNIELNNNILEQIKSYGTLIYTNYYIVKHDLFEPEYLVNVKHRTILQCVNENLYDSTTEVYKEYLSLNNQVKVYVKFASNGTFILLRSAYYDNISIGTNGFVIFESSTMNEEMDGMKYTRRVITIGGKNYYYIPASDVVNGTSHMFVVHTYVHTYSGENKIVYDEMGVYDVKTGVFYESQSVDETNANYVVKLSAQGKDICVSYKKIGGTEKNPVYEYRIVTNCVNNKHMSGGRKYGSHHKNNYRKKWIVRIR